MHLSDAMMFTRGPLVGCDGCWARIKKAATVDDSVLAENPHAADSVLAEDPHAAADDSGLLPHADDNRQVDNTRWRGKGTGSALFPVAPPHFLRKDPRDPEVPEWILRETMHSPPRHLCVKNGSKWAFYKLHALRQEMLYVASLAWWPLESRNWGYTQEWDTRTWISEQDDDDKTLSGYFKGRKTWTRVTKWGDTWSLEVNLAAGKPLPSCIWITDDDRRFMYANATQYKDGSCDVSNRFFAMRVDARTSKLAGGGGARVEDPGRAGARDAPVLVESRAASVSGTVASDAAVPGLYDSSAAPERPSE